MYIIYEFYLLLRTLLALVYVTFKHFYMRKLILLFILGMIFSGYTYAQRSITGLVLDANGTAVANASVLVKGTNFGTSSNNSGEFTIDMPAGRNTLVVSAVGMVEKEVSVQGINNVTITLSSSSTALDEVVVVGYGTQRRSEVTAAIGKIDAGPIATLVTPSIDQQLGGRTPGIQVTNPSGLVNQPPRIRIRGVNSVNGSRDPLIVLDGVPTFSGGYSGYTTNNVLANLNPADVESIEVLKDGSATAIYGSRAANGVILITTKKGKQGRVNINYDATFGFSKVMKRFDLLNAEEFVAIANEKLLNGGGTAQAKMNAERTNTDWQSVVFRDVAKSQLHNLSIDGGTERTRYFLSVNYADQQGSVITNRVKRYSIRANIEQKIGKWLTVSNLLSVARAENYDQNNGANSLSGAIYNSLRALPNVRVMDPTNTAFGGFNVRPDGSALGRDSNTRDIENLNTNLAYVLAKNKNQSKNHRIINNLSVDIKPFSWLTYTAKAGIDYMNLDEFFFWDPKHGDGRSVNGRLGNQAGNLIQWVLQNYVNIDKSFDKHKFGATLGIEAQGQQSNSFQAAGTGISDVFFGQQNIISGSYTTQLSSGGFSEAPGFYSYFGRVTYNYDNKYYLQGSLRRDGLSKLAPQNRFGNFPGLSIGYRISNENFWKDNAISAIINEFKIRASWARVGNVEIPGGSFPYLSQYASAPYGAISGISASLVGNPDLKWETNEKIDFGVDLGLFNRATLTFDYYKNKNNDQVFAVPTPVSLGVPGNQVYKNIGNMENSGFELGLNIEAIKSRDFRWDFGFNFTTVKNKVLTLPSGDIVGEYTIVREGLPINSLYGYQWAGVNSANGNPVWYKADGTTLVQGNIANSSYFGANSLSDGSLVSGVLLQAADKVILGTTLPKWFGGITNSFAYKGIGLDMLWRFSGGNMIMNYTRQQTLVNLGFSNNGREILDRWQKAGDVTNVPKLWYGRDNFINQNGNTNSRFVEKGDYIRLDNLQLYYDFSRNILNKIGNGNVFKSIRFYAQGQNLLLFSKYSGIDPDNITEAGVDQNVTPPVRIFSLGLNIGL